MSDNTERESEAYERGRADAVNLEQILARLEELRAELRAERISWGELAELQGLAAHIEPDDLELLEAAGVPESPATKVSGWRGADMRDQLRDMRDGLGFFVLLLAVVAGPPLLILGLRSLLGVE